LVPRYAFPTKSNVFDFQIDNAHIINTLLQLGVSDNDTGIKLLQQFSTLRKPLKRLHRPPALSTALKRGVNERLDEPFWNK